MRRKHLACYLVHLVEQVVCRVVVRVLAELVIFWSNQRIRRSHPVLVSIVDVHGGDPTATPASPTASAPAPAPAPAWLHTQEHAPSTAHADTNSRSRARHWPPHTQGLGRARSRRPSRRRRGSGSCWLRSGLPRLQWLFDLAPGRCGLGERWHRGGRA